MSEPKTGVHEPTLLEMILFSEREAERIDTWERVFQSENKVLDVSMAQRRLIYRRTFQTLDMVLKHADEFRRVCKGAQESEDRAKQKRVDRAQKSAGS